MVLGVSYDKGKLFARLDVLRGTNFEGIPASSKAAAMGAMTQTRVDLLVIAADLPDEDRYEITEAFRQKQTGKVVWARVSEPKNPPIRPDAYVEPDRPQELQRVMLGLVTSQT